MLENTPIWTHGKMHLWVNNKPAKVYVPRSNPEEAYQILQSRLSKEGHIPIGIDHLPDNIIEANPILAKLDLLNVGEITEIQYTDDAIKIVEAELTNPLIKQLYDEGELDMVSIVANSTTSECPRGDYDYIVDTTDITRVDIVEKGACSECNIPKPQSSDSTVVYARYSIENKKEETIMADEITMEAIEELLDKKLEEATAPINERLDALEKAEDPKPQKEEKEDEEKKAMEAKIADLQKETATAKVESLIAAGKLLPAQKESAVALCASDAKMFESMYKDAPVLVDFNKRSMAAGSSEDEGGEEDLTPEEENLNAVLNHFGGE